MSPPPVRRRLGERIGEWLVQFGSRRLRRELEDYREPEVRRGRWFGRRDSQQTFRSLIQVNFYPRHD